MVGEKMEESNFKLEITYDEESGAIKGKSSLTPPDIDMFNPLAYNAGFLLTALKFINWASAEKINEVTNLMMEEVDGQEEATSH